MAVREIIFADDPRLRQKAKKVKAFGPELQNLAEDMLETMHDAEGVGLAGPQIGVMLRVFVAQLPPSEEDPEPEPFVLVNPEFTALSEEIEEGQEGCLSIPGWAGLVDRHASVAVKAKDVKGRTVKLKGEGFLARIFQHEYDHLDGILYIDYISDEEKLWEITEEPESEEEALLEEQAE